MPNIPPKAGDNMQINRDLCINCLKCLPYCPIGALVQTDQGEVIIDYDECVECSVCHRSGVCHTDAFYREELAWPRVVRRVFSDPTAVHAGTGVAGRGTEEMKTNEITHRYRIGKFGMGVELGRPGVGTRLVEAEKITRRLARIGVHFEKGNPLTQLMGDEEQGILQDDIKSEKVLSAIVEFPADYKQLPEVLDALEEAAAEVDTVFSVGIIDRLTDEGEAPNIERAVELGYEAGPSAKLNVGLGRPGSST